MHLKCECVGRRVESGRLGSNHRMNENVRKHFAPLFSRHNKILTVLTCVSPTGSKSDSESDIFLLFRLRIPKKLLFLSVSFLQYKNAGTLCVARSRGRRADRRRDVAATRSVSRFLRSRQMTPLTAREMSTSRAPQDDQHGSKRVGLLSMYEQLFNVSLVQTFGNRVRQIGMKVHTVWHWSC